MENEFDKEEFLRQIHTIPSWVKNGDDLLKFCKHIQYRLLQTQAIDRWYQRNCKITDEQSAEVNEIYLNYNRAYENDKSKFQPFDEIFN